MLSLLQVSIPMRRRTKVRFRDRNMFLALGGLIVTRIQSACMLVVADEKLCSRKRNTRPQMVRTHVNCVHSGFLESCAISPSTLA